MTCIIGLLTKDKIYIGSDRLASSSGTGKKYHEAGKKLWKKGSEMIFGAAGSVRGAQLLAYATTIPPIKVGQSIDEYLIIDFTRAMKEALAIGGELHAKHGIELHFNHFILGYKGRLFTFFNDMGFLEVTDKYTSVGSGSPYALGSLYSTESEEMNPKERIELALETAQYYNAYVEGPYDIMSIKRETKDPMDTAMNNILEKANKMMEETNGSE